MILFYILGPQHRDRRTSVLVHVLMISLSQKWNPVKFWDIKDTCHKSLQIVLMRLKLRFCVPAIDQGRKQNALCLKPN